ncbi:MAG: ABC transporter substrate-binding protein [Methylomonas sp.]|uniref:ABC transporter substrate-binding protein n=1 Tax=Methylomonas sp. TaxID=418 RepID=UPI0025E7B62B|nr:ABC transporter substrate-binding protein [Methylomonas sp.]MCK9609397.1 ABC transporter substrate-binding protein [Methylomonas sp.]
MNSSIATPVIHGHSTLRTLAILLTLIVPGCQNEPPPPQPMLNWYVFDERSGAFRQAAAACSAQAAGRYQIALTPLPSDADQQREQLVRRLAAADSAIDIIGMDVIWTAEFAAAGWLLAWPDETSRHIANGRLPAAVASSRYKDRSWAVPFTSNAQLLWYRTDRIAQAPDNWQSLIGQAEAMAAPGSIQLQGQRYEGLTVFFVSLLASAGGSVLNANGELSLPDEATLTALTMMQRIATSPAVSPSLATDREDQSRLAFETGRPSFMLNYSFVWPSAHQNAPEVARHMAYSRWPAISPNQPSRVTLGGINLGIAAYGRHPQLAFEAAECLASAANQIKAAVQGGMPPTLEALYDNPEIRRHFPFADTLRDTLRDAVLRPPSPVYNDISLAISRTLHPMRNIEPTADLPRLRRAVQRALNSEGLL